MQTDQNVPAPRGRLTRRQYLGRASLAALGLGLVPALWAGAEAVGLKPKPAPPAADALLLRPSDFGSGSLRQIQHLDQRETRDGGQAAQVVLKDDRIRVFQTVVVFPSEGAARTALQAIRQSGAAALLEAVPAAPSFGEESVVLAGKQGTQDAVAAVFRQGPILVRLTLVGTREVSELTVYARRAEERVKQRSL